MTAQSQYRQHVPKNEDFNVFREYYLRMRAEGLPPMKTLIDLSQANKSDILYADTQKLDRYHFRQKYN